MQSVQTRVDTRWAATLRPSQLKGGFRDLCALESANRDAGEFDAAAGEYFAIAVCVGPRVVVV